MPNSKYQIDVAKIKNRFLRKYYEDGGFNPNDPNTPVFNWTNHYAELLLAIHKIKADSNHDLYEMHQYVYAFEVSRLIKAYTNSKPADDNEDSELPYARLVYMCIKYRGLTGLIPLIIEDCVDFDELQHAVKDKIKNNHLESDVAKYYKPVRTKTPTLDTPVNATIFAMNQSLEINFHMCILQEIHTYPFIPMVVQILRKMLDLYLHSFQLIMNLREMYKLVPLDVPLTIEEQMFVLCKIRSVDNIAVNICKSLHKNVESDQAKATRKFVNFIENGALNNDDSIIEAVEKLDESAYKQELNSAEFIKNIYLDAINAHKSVLEYLKTLDVIDTLTRVEPNIRGNLASYITSKTSNVSTEIINKNMKELVTKIVNDLAEDIVISCIAIDIYAKKHNKPVKDVLSNFDVIRNTIKEEPEIMSVLTDRLDELMKDIKTIKDINYLYME